MLNPDTEMDSRTVYTPDVEPMTQADMDELAALFSFLREEEAA